MAEKLGNYFLETGIEIGMNVALDYALRARGGAYSSP